MEGTAGVVDWSQCLAPEPEYQYYRGLLQDEVNAAIDGAMAAGATEFLRQRLALHHAEPAPRRAARRARYLSGRHKPMYMMQGLDASFDAVFFVSYHGSMASEASTLSHTYNPRAITRVLLNGIEVGESGINALVALGHGVPVVLITGDDTTAEEAAPICPGVVPARGQALGHPVRGRVAAPGGGQGADPRRRPPRRSRASAAAASPADQPAGDAGGAVPHRRHGRDGDLAARRDRVDARTVTVTDDDPVRLFRTFVTVVQLTRAIVE